MVVPTRRELEYALVKRHDATRERLDLLSRRFHGPSGLPPEDDRRQSPRASPDTCASNRASASLAASGRCIVFFFDITIRHMRCVGLSNERKG